MVTVNNITINVTNLNLGQASVILPIEKQHSVKCVNNDTEYKAVQCELLSPHRQRPIVENVSFPFNILSLNGYFTKISLNLDTIYNVSSNLIMGNEDRPEVLKATASWTLNHNNIENTSVASNLLRNSSHIIMPLANDTCLNITFMDYIKVLSVNYNALATMQIFHNNSLVNGNKTNSLASSIVGSTTTISADQSIITFPITGVITLNTLRDEWLNQTVCPVNLPSSPFNRTNRTEPDLSLYNSSSFNYDFLTIRQLPSNIASSLIDALESVFKLVESAAYALEFATTAATLGIVRGATDEWLAKHDVFDLDFEWEFINIVWDCCYLRIFGTCVLCFPVPVFYWYDFAHDYEINGLDKIQIVFNTHYNTRNLYKFITFGKFDPTLSHPEQFVVNDVNGVKIISTTGETLREFPNFCTKPYVIKSSSISPYWNILYVVPLHVRAFFKYYDNHDLYRGGVRVGDFNGDGIDDLWCQYPGRDPYKTKNYDGLNGDNNIIIFDPLQKTLIPGDKCSYDETLNAPDLDNWCKEGISLVGKFDFNKQEDIICIDYTRFYILYGQEGGTFLPANHNIANEKKDGRLNLSISTSTWTPDHKVLVGDFDGDRYSDLIKINQNSVDILYGSKNGFFVQRTNTHQSFKNLAGITQCYNVDINLFYIRDIDKDGRDDIMCIKGSEDIIIFSRVDGYTNPLNKITMVVHNVALKPAHHLQNIQRNNDLSITSINNTIPANQNAKLNNVATLEKQVIHDIYFPFDCAKLDNFDSVVHFALSDSYNISETVLWKDGKTTVNHLVDLEFSAQWINQKLEIISNQVNTYNVNTALSSGVCLNSKLNNNYISLIMNYNASVQMYIEESNLAVPISGERLKEIAQEIIPTFELDNTGESVIFPIQGHVILNLLGIGYGESTYCD